MAFYVKCLDAQLQLSSYSSIPGEVPEAEKDRIIHARLSTGSILLMASDIRPGMPFLQGDKISIFIGCESLPEIERLFAAFLVGGIAKMPLHDSFWGARFGIHWMFNFEYPK